ncbi:MAG: hypothetical protein NXH75_17405, partial [Halobacteriovoraceae bacterium]|nr:hypothetical protein [Halobacteriovoraceae bacterium]
MNKKYKIFIGVSLLVNLLFSLGYYRLTEEVETLVSRRDKLTVSIYNDIYEILNLVSKNKNRDAIIYFYKIGFPLKESRGAGIDILASYKEAFRNDPI